MPKQCPDTLAAAGDDCPPVILRLERARLAEPRTPSLTLPEWELLRGFGLGTLAAVRRRMDERAMLAAYDGAPSALSEFTTERLPAAAARASEASRDHVPSPQRYAETLETRLDYDPERLRATMQCTVMRSLREREGVAAPRRGPEAYFYAVTFDVRDGGVILRECGAVPQTSGTLVGRSDVVREFVPQSAR